MNQFISSTTHYALRLATGKMIVFFGMMLFPLLLCTVPTLRAATNTTSDTPLQFSALSEKTDTIFLHTTEGLGHKRILRDNAVVDVITSYIFKGQLKHDVQFIKT